MIFIVDFLIIGDNANSSVNIITDFNILLLQFFQALPPKKTGKTVFLIPNSQNTVNEDKITLNNEYLPL